MNVNALMQAPYGANAHRSHDWLLTEIMGNSVVLYVEFNKRERLFFHLEERQELIRYSTKQ